MRLTQEEPSRKSEIAELEKLHEAKVKALTTVELLKHEESQIVDKLESQRLSLELDLQSQTNFLEKRLLRALKDFASLESKLERKIDGRVPTLIREMEQLIQVPVNKRSSSGDGRKT